MHIIHGSAIRIELLPFLLKNRQSLIIFKFMHKRLSFSILSAYLYIYIYISLSSHKGQTMCYKVMPFMNQDISIELSQSPICQCLMQDEMKISL